MKYSRIPSIKEGIVVDHICLGKGQDVINILNLSSNEEISYTFGVRYDSNKMGKKEVLKIEGKSLSEEELNKIALVVPNATVSRISNYNVVIKKKVELPSFVGGIVKCFNPNCVTRYENVKTKFKIINKDPIILRCFYCEKSSSKIELV